MCEVAVIYSPYFVQLTGAAILCWSMQVTNGVGKNELSEKYSSHQHADSNVQHLNKVQLFFLCLQHLFVILDM